MAKILIEDVSKTENKMFISGSLDDLVNLLCDTYYADGKIFSLFAASVAIYMES
jgi:hypothetical protein